MGRSVRPARRFVRRIWHPGKVKIDAPLNDALDRLEDDYGLNPPDDAVYEAFIAWARSTGRELYPHQEESLLAALAGDHLIVATPTGSGKSLIAMAVLFAQLARGGGGYYTAPLKALVSEKFFDLIGLFGAANVGMVTGDSTINPDAPIICCTAEILANIALREGAEADIDSVIADEFHFYSEPDRGWAWQVPLLILNRAQHVLLSATLGDVSGFVADLERRTGRAVSVIDNAERPVPLSFEYRVDTMSETIKELVETHRAPVYVVHFTQAQAVASATELRSIAIATKEQKAAIAEAIGDFRFGPGFGTILSRLVRSGVGVHHAGMLPRYRRLVERLAQQGLLRVICGTDTLGVGINVPIRTVCFTSLVKYDGTRSRQLSAREFHQIAGRAGRAGFDTTGEVVALAPEHEVDNAKALAKAEGSKKKPQLKKAPEGKVNWTQATFERLIEAQPETLTSQMRLTHAMMLNLLARPGDPLPGIISLITDNHEPKRAANPLIRSAIDIYFSLRSAGVIEHHDREWRDSHEGGAIELKAEVPDDFALNAPLSPFALAALDLLDEEDPDYALNVLSIIEAVQEDPRPVLFAQRRAARDEAMAAMKAEGLEYNERMARLDEITWPKPLEDLLEPAFETYSHTNPWVRDHELSEKSIVRAMVENAMTFSDLVSRYDVARSEGVVLRYLTDTYKALRQIVPEEKTTEELAEIIDWLGELIASVDSSLIMEWEALADGAVSEEDLAARETIPQGDTERAFGANEDGSIDLNRNRHALKTAGRNWIWQFVEAAANDDVEQLALLSRQSIPRFEGLPHISAEQWDAFLDSYFDSHEWLGADTGSRSGEFFSCAEGVDSADLELQGISPALAENCGKLWLLRQVIDDGEDSRDVEFVAVLDVASSMEKAVCQLIRIGEVK